MNNSRDNPRILIVTPEVTYLPKGMGNISNYLSAKAGGLADVSAALISALFEQGADVHVAIPDYRTIFGEHLNPLFISELTKVRRRMPYNDTYNYIIPTEPVLDSDRGAVIQSIAFEDGDFRFMEFVEILDAGSSPA